MGAFRFALSLALLLCGLLVMGPARGMEEDVLPPEFGSLAQPLAEALAALNLTEADLGWNKWPGEGKLRLQAVQRSLEDPLALFSYQKKLGEVARNPVFLLSFALGEMTRLDDGAERRQLVSRGELFPRPGLPPDPLSNLARVKRELKDSRLGLEPSEVEELYGALPFLWSDPAELAELPSGEVAGLPLENPPSLSGDRLVELVGKFDWSSLARLSLTALRSSLMLAEKASWGEIGGLELRRALLPAGLKVSGEYRYGYLKQGGLSVLLLGKGDNRVRIERLSAQPDLILDLGGDDTYRGYFAAGAPFGVLIDLGGNDQYLADRRLSGAGALGGIGLLLDLSGDDLYRGIGYTLASAFFGTAVLMDVERKLASREKRGDLFVANGEHALAAATAGVALLISDEPGPGEVVGGESDEERAEKVTALAGAADTYRCYRFCEGFAGPLAVGVLVDRWGNDLYYAGGKFLHYPLYNNQFQGLAQGFSIGWRYQGIAGGVGALIDQGGNDVYITDIYGQGAGYWYGLGLLIDEMGNDRYEAVHYAQGAGIHLASGMLMDRAGNDSYTSPYGPSQGSGHDLAVGILVDMAGNDHYMTEGIGLGQGHFNALGLLVDFGGDDIYSGRPNAALGHGTPLRGYPGVGLFFDLAGRDLYPLVEEDYPGMGQARNNALWTRGELGAGIDLEPEGAGGSS